MKNKIKKILSLSLLSVLLTGCGEAGEKYTLYKSKWENGKTFEAFLESETSTKEVYVGQRRLSNPDLVDFEMEAKDLVRTTKDNTKHTALYFVKSYKFTTVNGEIVSCLTKTSDKETASKKEHRMDNFLPAFDVDGGEEFTLTYKNTIIDYLTTATD